MTTPLETAGFICSPNRPLGHERRSVALAAFITSAALAVSTIVAATVVSVGIARAGAADSVLDNEAGLFTVALLLGLVAFIGIGGISLLPPRSRP
jgi:hypothetical protein